MTNSSISLKTFNCTPTLLHCTSSYPTPHNEANLAAIKTKYALWYFLKICLLVGTPIFLITIATQLAVGGINFAPKAMSFKGSKLNPIKGMKNIISIKSLVELGKSILK